MKNTQKTKAFTLVELIIVITILAILATIGFMSFQSYTADARDGKRKTDLGSIRKGLELYQTKNAILPTPDEKRVTVYTGTTASTIAIQGYMGTTAQKDIRISEVKDDDNENIYYTYSTNSSKTKYSLLAMLENQENLAMKNNLVKQTYARINYETRYPYTVGNYVVFFSGTTNTPLQNITGTGLNLSGNTTQIKAIISGTGTTTFTGYDLPTAIEIETNSSAGSSSGGGEPIATCSDSIQNQDETGVDCGGSCTACVPAYNQAATYVKRDSFTYDSMTWYVSANTKVAYTKPSLTNDLPNNLTNTDHILVFSGNEKYILRTVNQGATQVYNYGTSYTSGRLWNEGSTYGTDSATRKTIYESDKSMLGDYYQWGRNYPVSLTGTTISLYNTTGYQTGGVNYASNNGFIINPNSPYSWLGTNHASSSSIIWTDANNPGPCLDANYRLPTTSASVGVGEWRRVVEIVTLKTASWVQADRQTLQKYLLLPFAGYRIYSTGDFNNQGSNGFYWSSSINGDNGHTLLFVSTGINPGNYDNRAHGFSVRCFKN